MLALTLANVINGKRPFSIVDAWILNADIAPVPGTIYVWKDASTWTDLNIWKD